MKYVLFILFFIQQICCGSTIYLNSHHNKINVKSWKELRDYNVVKQDLDYSCGSASIATILNGYYQQNVTEEQILKIIDKGDLMASFEDMQKALKKLGFESKGYAVSFDTLQKLKIPVIAYIKHRKSDHFTVISGINENFVRIADPSLGSRVLSTEQFKQMWETRSDDHLKGKILVILPTADKQTNTSFFTRHIKQPTVQSIKFISSQR